jgi:preprotein translocase subunit SecB
MSEQANGATTASEQPQILIQRVYLKDMSFESPNAPQSFSGEWKPEVSVELQNKGHKVADNTYEVSLSLTITAKSQDKTLYLAEIHQAGLFRITNVPEEAIGQVLGAFCPNILFPYAREAVDNLVARGSFPTLMLAPVNFDALYAQNIAQRAAANNEVANEHEEDTVMPEQKH